MTDEIIERSFPVTGKAELTLSNISGSVVILPTEADQIDIKVTKHNNGMNASQTKIELSQAEDGKVTAATRYENGILGFLTFSSPCNVDYEVHIPRECSVQASGVSSGIKAYGLHGDLRFNTVSGDLAIESASGDLTISAVSGNVKGQEIQGKLNLKTVSGDIDLRGVIAASVEASTVSGNMHLQAELTGGPYALKSVSGDTRLELPEGAACHAELRTVSGNLQTSFANAKHTNTPGMKKVEFGSGGPLITANSISGNLWITGEGSSDQPIEAGSEQEVQANSPKPTTTAPQKDHSSEERMAVLERISKGEISVEEGLQELNSK